MRRGIWNALAVAALLCLPMVGSAQQVGSPYILHSAGSSEGSVTTGITIEDEFISGLQSTGNIGNLGWSFACASGTAIWVDSEANRPGIYRLTSAASANCSLFLSSNTGPGILTGSQTATYHFVARFGTGANIPKRRVGLNTAITGDGSGDGIYFETLNDGNWFAVTNDGAGETRADTGVAFSANTWFNFYITLTTGVSSAVFKVNSTTLAAQSGNFPAVVAQPYFQIFGTGTAGTLDVEFFAVEFPAK